MQHDPPVDEPLSAVEYWSRPNVVDRWTGQRAVLSYEQAIIDRACRLAEESGPLRRVHVVGVGAGRELAAVRSAAPEARILAWDVSPTMVEAARSYVDDARLEGVEVDSSDVADLSRSAGAADVVIAINAVLSYLTTPDHRHRSASAVFELLRAGGSLAVVVQQRNGRADWALWFALRSLATRLGLAPGGAGDRFNGQGRTRLLVHHYSKRELAQLFRAVGFADLHVQSLRQWSRGEGTRVPLRSPNPLMLLGRRP